MTRLATNPLEVRAVTKRFGMIEALRGVSFDIEPAEVFGYLGPNGAGKTTTLRIILGLVRATTGEVKLFSQPPLGHAARRDIGFTPGDLRLYGDMTGAATLDFFARFRPDRPPVLRRKLLDALALEEAMLQRRVKHLSHGTRQKLGLIVAMQHDPALLLLDEPSNGLDPIAQHAFRDFVRDFAARGRSVLFSTHVLSEAQDVCRRVAIVRRGEIVALETIEKLRSNMVRRLNVRLRGNVPPGLLESPAVTRSEVVGTQAALWVRGDLNPILRALAAAEVEDLVFPEPQLEDIFLSYYTESADARA